MESVFFFATELIDLQSSCVVYIIYRREHSTNVDMLFFVCAVCLCVCVKCTIDENTKHQQHKPTQTKKKSIRYTAAYANKCACVMRELGN